MSRFYLRSAGTNGLRRKLYLAVLTALSGNAYALPQGAQVTAGQANINGSDTTLTIEQNSQRAVLEYDSFNVAAHEQVDFIQPNGEAVALNRVLGSNLSEIHGTINANGQVYLINPHGVLFGAGAEVNVGGLVATTLDTSDADFINQREHFRGQAQGLVENRGRINAASRVVLLGADVTNSGQINVPGGEVMLRSSRDVLLHSAGSEIPILVEDPQLVGRVVNEGEVRAGRVAMVLDGQGSRDVYDNAINNHGIVRAVNARGEGGSVELLAAGGDVVNQGIVDASARQGSGGTINLQAERYGQTGELKVDGSDKGNGGSIDLNVEDTLVLHPTARLSANAGERGKGGDIIVYSHNATWYTEGAGISARGGDEAGDGGFVEVSGRNLINIASAVDVGANAGRAGLWYIDPTDISIQANSQSGGAFTLNAGDYLWTLDDPAPAISTISVQTLMDSLMDGDVIIDTASAETSPGDISVAASIDFQGMPAGRSLTLRADRNVSFQGAAGVGDSDFNDNDWFNLNIEAGGDVLLNSTSFINVRSGTLTVDVSGDFTLAGTASMVAHVADINAAGAFTMHAESSVLITDRFDVAANDDITLAAIESHGSAEDTLRFTSSNGAIIDDGDATTSVEIAGSGIGNGGVFLQAATGIGNVGLGTTKLGVVNTTSGNVALTSAGDLTLTSIGLGDDMVFDISAAGDLIYSGSLGRDLTGATGSAINLNAGANLLISGSLAGASPADHNVDINLTAATDVAMQDGVLIDSGTGFISVTAQGGNATVTGLTAANTAVDSISVFAPNGAIMDAGNSQSDLSVPDGGFVLRSMAGISGLETQSNFIDVVSSAGGVSLSEAASVEVLRLQAAGTVTLAAGDNLSFANSAVINVPELSATAGDAIIVPDTGLNASGRLDLTGTDIYAQSGRQLSLQAPRVNISSASAAGDSIFDVVALILGISAFGSNDISVNASVDSVAVTNNGTGLLSVTDVDTLALRDVAANSGTTEVTSASGFHLTIDEDVDLDGAQGDLQLNAGNNLVVNAVIADLTGAENNSGDIALTAGSAVTFASTARADAGSGNIAISAGGDVTLARIGGSSINIDSAAQIIDGNGAAGNLEGSNATLSAAGDIGSAAERLDVALSSLLLAGQNVYLQSPGALAAGVSDNTSVENLVIHSGADLTLLGGSGSINGDADFSVTGGALLLPGGGFSVPGNLQVQADHIAGSGGPAVLQASDAIIRLNASANATELDTTFNSLVLQVAGSQGVSISDSGDLNVVGVDTLGDLSLQSAGDLSISDAGARFAGNLALNAAGDLSVAEGILSVTDTLTITAQNLSDGDNNVGLTAGSAVIDLQQDAALTLATAVDSLDFSNVGSASVTVNESDSLTVLGLTTGADLAIHSAAGDIEFSTANVAVAGLLNLTTLGSGAIVLSELGLTTAGGLQVNAASIRDSDNQVTLVATDANITVRDGAIANVWDTTLDRLIANVAGNLSVSNSDGLVVEGLTVAGNAGIATTAGDLQLSAEPQVAGDLTLTASGSGDVVLNDGGLSHGGVLSITANNLRDGDNQVILAASDARITLRDGSTGSVWNTSFDTLVADVAGDLSVTDDNGLVVAGLTVAGDAQVATAAGDLQLAADPQVAGDLSLRAAGAGDIILNDAGLSHNGVLSIAANNLRDSDNRVTLAAIDADITLRDGSAASVLNTAFDTLVADVAGDLSVSDSDNLVIAGLTVAGNAQVATAAGDLQLNVDPQVAGSLGLIANGSGGVVLTDDGLNHGGALFIEASNLRDSDYEVTLAARDADITLRNGSVDSTWNTAFDTLVADVAGNLSVVDVGGLSLLGLAAAGAVDISATDGNLTVDTSPSVSGELRLATVGSGDLVLPADGLQHQGVLRLEADHIVDGDSDVILAADQLVINQRRGDAATVFNTTSEALQLIFNGSNSVYVNETGDLQLVNLLAGGNANISAGGDISLPDALDVGGLLSLSTSNAGQIIVSESGINTSGDLSLDAAAIAGAAEVVVQANDADISLRNQQQALTLATSVQQLGFTSASAAQINLWQSADLTLARLSAGGDVNVTAGGNLTVLPSTAEVSGGLSLDVGEVLTIADGGLSTGAALSVDAAEVANASGFGSTQWQAQRADFRIRQSVQNNSLDTSVSELGLRFDGGAPLTVTTQSATGITGLSANNNLHIISAGDLAMQTALTSVNGLLTLETNGDLQLTENGLTVMDALQVDARNMSSSAGSVMLNGTRADINLTGSSALDLNTRLAELGLSFASAEALRLSNSGNLTINRWQASSADSAGLSVDGTLTIPPTGLAAARLLRIDAHDLSDGDRNLTLQAPQLQVRLSASTSDNIWQVDGEQFDVSLRGKANLQVLADAGLALEDLNGDGNAVSLADGNFTLQLDSGDLHINSNVTAQDQSADGARGGIIDIVAAGGDIVVGAEQDVAILSSNTVDGDSENAIRLQLSDSSDTSRQIALGNGSNSVVLRAVGGDIALHARPAGITTNARREIVQSAGVAITAYNNPGDAPGGTVLINGKEQAAQPWQDIRQGRTLALLADVTTGPDFDAIQDELDDIGDTIVEAEPPQEQGADAAQQFEAVFGRCDELDRSGSRRCRVDAALKSFLSHWLVGGEMPPKSEI